MTILIFDEISILNPQNLKALIILFCMLELRGPLLFGIYGNKFIILCDWFRCFFLYIYIYIYIHTHLSINQSLFNLSSNADRTPTPIFRRKHLDVTLSTCAQLLWTTYPWLVLSGPRTFKMLDDLSHCAAAQFQRLGNLVALVIFM